MMKLHGEEIRMQRFEPSENGFQVYTDNETDEEFLYRFVKKSNCEAITASCSFLDGYNLLYNFNNLDDGMIEIYTVGLRT